MHIVLGIGNPGSKYEGTRHNVGFLVVETLAKRLGKRFRKMGFEYDGVEATLAGRETVLVRPGTYVNATGRILPELRKRHDELGANFLAVCDDFALPLGALRLRKQGSSGGHNGLKSIIEAHGSDAFARLRVGIGGPAGDAADHVLARFSKKELPAVEESVEAAANAVECWVSEGIESAMTKFNRTVERGT